MVGSAARPESPARHGAEPPPPEARILSGEARPPSLTPGDPARSAAPPGGIDSARALQPPGAPPGFRRRTGRFPADSACPRGPDRLLSAPSLKSTDAFGDHRGNDGQDSRTNYPQSPGADPRQGYRRSRGRRPRDRGHRGGKARRDQEVIREGIFLPEGRRTENGRPRGRGSAFEVRERDEEAGRCRKRPIDGEGRNRRSLEGSDRGRPRF